jgi:hypothetical protein
MKTKRTQDKRRQIIQRAIASGVMPLSQTVARRGIVALNHRIVRQTQIRYVEHKLIARESKRILAPLLKIIRKDKPAMKATQDLRRLTTHRKTPKITYPKVLQRVDAHVRAGSILRFFGPPYDAEWGDNSSSDDTTDTTWGSWVAIKSPPDPRFNSTTNIGNGGSAWSSAGVGKWFVPDGQSTWVRIGLYAPYEYDWRLDSNWETAHSDAFIGIYVQSFDFNGGDPRDEVDRRIGLWSEGTSWQQDHADSGSGYYPSDTYFMASNARQYIVWAWCGTSGDASSGSLAYSYSWGTLSVALPFMVFEEWT